tara:strand:- start:29502 stop:29792 length:291 start_codon:yes stop_codon:yes gene_type:complete
MKKLFLFALLNFACASNDVKKTHVAALPVQTQTTVPKIELTQLTSFKKISTWNGWVCADYLDNRNQSVWYREDLGIQDLTVYDNDCAYWGNHPPKE